MKITLSIDSKETIELGFSDVANFAGWLEDENYASFFSLLAKHPSSEVRCTAAYKSFLPLKTLRKLAIDPSIEVVRVVASNKMALKNFSASLIKKMIDRDVSVAAIIADNLHSLRDDAQVDIIVTLAKHSDPKVADVALEFEYEHEQYLV
jgi:HEAT repeat protein